MRLAHHQPGRLARVAPRRSMLSADRLQGIDGLGNLAAADDYGMGTDEETYGYGNTSPIEQELESDSDYSWLVKDIIGAAGKITPAALTLAGKLSEKKGIGLNDILGLAQGRATAVQNGTMGLPTGAWIGIGVAAALGLGLLFMTMGRR